MERKKLIEAVQEVDTDHFDAVALEIYRFQIVHNIIYRKFVDTLLTSRGLRLETFSPKTIQEIPFLPISFFKSEKVISGDFKPDVIYTSSSTTGMIPSQHYVRNEKEYLIHAASLFESNYGKLDNFVILALLPGYLERKGSSLVAMAQYFIQESSNDLSGFYLHDYKGLLQSIDKAKLENKKILLLGVSFALWELAELNVDLSDVIVMETGGMKGRGPELPKAAFHEFLKKGLNINKVHSEYGMTELLSQSYSSGETIFTPSRTMKILTSEVTDPFTWQENMKGGIIHVVDLMNIDSCSFIVTEDLGLVQENGDFQILGRLDQSEVRGCNLLVSDL